MLTRLTMAMILVSATVAGVAAACERGNNEERSPEEARQRAADATRSLQSVHFVIAHEQGGTPLGGGLTLLSAEGDGLLPDRAALNAHTVLQDLGLTLQMRIVQIGNETYLRDPISGVWRTAEPETLPFNFVGVHDSVADAIEAMADLALADGPSIDGAATYHLTGNVPSEAFRGLVPGVPEGFLLHLEVWAGKDDDLPRRMRLTGTLLETDPPNMVRDLRLNRFNAPVTIEPPL